MAGRHYSPDERYYSPSWMRDERRYSLDRTPDEYLKEKARALQSLRNTNPEFRERKRGHVSPILKRENGLPFKSYSPPGFEQGYRMTWSQERHRLAGERERIQAEEDGVKQARKRWSLPHGVLDPIGQRSNSNDKIWKSGIDDFVLKIQDSLPDRIANLERLKEELKKDKKEFRTRDILLPAPKSYKPWQMADYYLVRDILLDVIDEAVERSESKPKPRSYQDKAKEHATKAAVLEVDAARKQHSQEMAIKLFAEEFMLEVTGVVSRQTAEEYLSVQHYANSLKQQLVMQSAEVTATGNPIGRTENDPAFDLVTSTYEKMSKDRSQGRKDIWAHSQKLHLQKTESNQDQNITVESLAPDDAIPLNLLHLPVKVGRPPVQNSPEMKRFRDQETAFWKMFSTEQESITLTKKVQGIVTAEVSPNHCYLALGCLRGDVLVYSLATSRPLPIRCIQNESNQTDAVIHIAWSLDSSRLTTINETGILQLWSMSSGGVSQKDIRDLELKSQPGVPMMSQLTQLLVLDAEKADFNFKEGSLKETGALTSAVNPGMSVFHPSHTLLATQNAIVVGLMNGDILKCNTSTSPKDTEGILMTASYSKSDIDAQDNFIGQDVPTELFRCHKSTLAFVGFIGFHGNMVSMDTSGLICVWEYSRESFSHFGWFEPSTKYKLELAERVYAPRQDDVPKVHFSDEALVEKKYSRQERVAARDRATQRIQKLDLGVLWHREMNTSSAMLQIYSPRNVPETGSMFHGIIKHAPLDQLLKHYTFNCKPAKNFCSRFLKAQQTPSCGMKLVLMLLFPACSPKGPHISFVVLSLKDMSVSDTRIDLSLSEEQHDKCLDDNVCNFAITPVFATTGSHYLIACVLGTFHIYSMETTYQLIEASVDTLSGSKAKRAIAERSMVQIAMTKGNLYIITYAPRLNTVDILQMGNNVPVRSRRHVYEAYLNWQKKKSNVPYELQHRNEEWMIDNDMYRNIELFAHRLVLQLADIAVYVSEGSEIDKTHLKQCWKDDKVKSERDFIQRIQSRRSEEATRSQDDDGNENPD